MFLAAVGFWNFLGAGVFGFLINLPIVSYYEVLAEVGVLIRRVLLSSATEPR